MLVLNQLLRMASAHVSNLCNVVGVSLTGDVVYDDQSGFWLVHSLPHFPPQVNTSYGYPHSGLVYGQTFICVTYPAKYFDLIGV